MCAGLYESVLIELEFSWQICDKSSCIEFRENPSSGSNVVPGGCTDMIQLIIAFLSVPNAHYNTNNHSHVLTGRNLTHAFLSV